MGDTLESSSKEEIEAAIKDVRDNLESDDVTLLRQKTDALQAAFHKVSEQMYAAAAQQQAAGGNGAPGPDGAPTDASADEEEEVVDAEVVEGEDKA
jgi:molecular chaperone DnaK